MSLPFYIDSWENALQRFVEESGRPAHLFTPKRMVKRLSKQQKWTIAHNWGLREIAYDWNDYRCTMAAQMCHIRYSREMSTTQLKAALVLIAYELGVR